MSSGASLGCLAEMAGVGTQYWDIWGNLHTVPEAAQRSILAALGVDAADQAQIEASIEKLQPVMVALMLIFIMLQMRSFSTRGSNFSLVRPLREMCDTN